MKKEFLIDRQGKTFALYAGLLDEAHQHGLVSIATKIEQLPSKENGDTTVCSAVVTLDQAGVVKQFHGIGDANPLNVGRNIAAHAIRMAETRAKARALRDAINVGTVALEELGDDDDPPAYQARQERATPTPLRQPPPRQPNGVVDVATPAQVRAIYLIARDQHGLSEETIDERSRGMYGTYPAELTKKQASTFITALKGGEPDSESEELPAVPSDPRPAVEMFGGEPPEAVRLRFANLVDEIQAANKAIKPRWPADTDTAEVWEKALAELKAKWAESPHNPANKVAAG